METMPEYILSTGSGVTCPQATNLSLCLPSCLTAKMRWTLIFWYPFLYLIHFSIWDHIGLSHGPERLYIHWFGPSQA